MLITLAILLAGCSWHCLRHCTTYLRWLSSRCFSWFTNFLHILSLIFFLRLKWKHVLSYARIFRCLCSRRTKRWGHRLTLGWRFCFRWKHDIIRSRISLIVCLHRNPYIYRSKQIFIFKVCRFCFCSKRLYASWRVALGISSNCGSVPRLCLTWLA